MRRLMTLSLCAMAATALFSLTSGVGFAQASDPVMGTWTFNPAKSTFTPGPGFKTGTVTYALGTPGIKVSVEAVTANGEKLQWGFAGDYDGKEYPVTGNPDADLVVLKRIDTRTTEASYKKAGKPTLTSTRVLSADGKTLTVTVKGTNAKGETVNNVLVFDKG